MALAIHLCPSGVTPSANACKSQTALAEKRQGLSLAAVSPAQHALVASVARGRQPSGALILAWIHSSERRRTKGAATVSRDSEMATDAEKAGWEKRMEESKEAGAAPPSGSIDGWRWTLNWNTIVPHILVGSCPRSPSDVDRLIEEAGVTAILNLQSDVCFEALHIPFADIHRRSLERGVYLQRVPVFDFDRGDQALMLPEAVRVLNVLRTRGHTVYVHCTAGINRASLATVGYLTFVQGHTLEEAVHLVKLARPVANPYIECWTEVQRRLLEGRNEELIALAEEVYRGRCADGSPGDAVSDWTAAQRRATSRSFGRWLEVDMGVLVTERELARQELRHEMSQGAVGGDAAPAVAGYRGRNGSLTKSAVEDKKRQGSGSGRGSAGTEAARSREVEEGAEGAQDEGNCNVITRECGPEEGAGENVESEVARVGGAH